MIDIATARSYNDEYPRYLESNFGIMSFNQISHGGRTLSSSLVVVTDSVTDSVI